MELVWTRQQSPAWDADKERIIGGAPEGSLDEIDRNALTGDWWAASDAGTGRVVGFGWMDATWGGDAEILLAVDPQVQGQGVGAFVLDQLEREAAERGINYVYNTVRETHPDREHVHDWLASRGYRGSDRDEALRKRVQLDEGAAPAPEPRPLDVPPERLTPPGNEEQGGYVNVEQHRY